MSEYLNEDICQFSNDASASSFGWNFQANAGIFLFLKYMPDAADVKAEIKRTIKNQNSYISKIYKYVLEYATQLNVDDKMVAKEDFIFTSDLKSISGAVLQKMVFAFKMAFLKVIEESMDTKLFIVLDSPKGKELDDDNMKLIENLVSTELCDNQIFFASIYDLEHEKLIEIKNRAIEGRNN